MSEPTPSRPSRQRFVASLVALVVLMAGLGTEAAASARAVDRSGVRLEAQAVVSSAPGRAARYAHKAEYVCFTREDFAPGAQRDMPVRFYLTPALPADVDVVTLAYTYYNVAPDGATAAGRRLD